MTDWNFEGRIVIITGGGSGIGKQAALDFAKYKANVVIFDINEENGKKVEEEIKNAGGNAIYVKVDIMDQTSVKNAVAQVKEKFEKIDVLVNCAGGQSAPKKFLRTKKKDWDFEIGLNLYGTLNCTQAVLRTMIKQKYGRIINISSDAGKTGEPLLAVYAAAKGGVQSFSKSLAKEVGPDGITVNVICPGTTRTPLTALLFKDPNFIAKMTKRYPMRRLGEPQDITNGILFLASEESGWITGQVISISGGYTMC
ncbi:MAG: SDR family NAD(P)-dependent oxidoreductase [Promethearchaeia archaeon]